jgi:transketolase
MLLYSLLYMSGYDISLNDIERLRQIGSRATGHPELSVTPGVEITTGPLGQGIASAVGMAIAERMLGARLNAKRAIVDYYTYVLVGDGDLMEGVSYEASSLAGHLKLGKLIVFYDSNGVTIEGPTQLCFTENVRKRFEACHWQVLEVGAYDIQGMVRCVSKAKNEREKPTLIIANSVIAKGCATLEGSFEAHGAPLGEKEVSATKRALGIPENSEFFIPEAATYYFREKEVEWERRYVAWQEEYRLWAQENPEKSEELKRMQQSPSIERVQLPHFKLGEEVPTRVAAGKALTALAREFTNIVGGSADLSHSTSTNIEGLESFTPTTPTNRIIYFGIREHAMGAIANGIAVNRLFRVFCSTYLVFSDYLRPSIRLAALMKLPVIYVFTHDSILVGEDGPTHQPVEQVASLRAIPGLLVVRPGDAEEAVAAWKMAIMRSDGPTALILCRQPLKTYEKSDAQWQQRFQDGAYVASNCTGTPNIVIIATGSEVNLAMEVKDGLGGDGVRVVSMPCRELFMKAPRHVQEWILPATARRIVIEAGIPQGWEGIAGDAGVIVCVREFGKTGTIAQLREAFGFDVKSIIEKIARKEN